MFLVLGSYLLLGNPINKIPALNNKNCFSDLKINEISLNNAIKILPEIGFLSGPY